MAILFSNGVSGAPSHPHAPMKNFALLFRQTRPLTELERKPRAEKIRVWVERVAGLNQKLDPHILEPEGVLVGTDGKHHPIPKEDGPLGAILLTEAKDLDDAVKFAESHPALEYGASVEVRPWTLPVPVPNKHIPKGGIIRMPPEGIRKRASPPMKEEPLYSSRRDRESKSLRSFISA